MNKSLPPSAVQSTRFRGERLRELRESKCLDIESLAKRLALTAAQLRQLESNQGSLFYSNAIRLATARKVSAFLGESLVLEPASSFSEGQTQGLVGEPLACTDEASHPLAPAPKPVLRISPGEPRIALTVWTAALWSVVVIFAVLLGLQALTEPKVTAPESTAEGLSWHEVREASAFSVVALPEISLVPRESRRNSSAALQVAPVWPLQTSAEVNTAQAAQTMVKVGSP